VVDAVVYYPYLDYSSRWSVDPVQFLCMAVAAAAAASSWEVV